MSAKLTVFWRQLASRALGWSENFYTTVNTLSLAGDVADALLARLRPLHGYQTSYQAVRVSMLDANGYPTRTTRLFESSSPGSNNENAIMNNANNAHVTSDYPTTALLLRGTMANGTSTRQWIKGIPDTIIDGGGFYVPNAQVNWNGVAQQFLTFLSSPSSSMGVHVHDTSYLKHLISGLNYATQVVTTFNPHQIPGSYFPVRIYGVKGDERRLANRVWTAVPVTATTFSLPGLTELTTSGLDWTNAYVQALAYTVAGATFDFMRATGRQVGKPFGLVSGHRTNR